MPKSSKIVIQCTSLAKTLEGELYNGVRMIFPSIKFIRNISVLHVDTTHLLVPDNPKNVRQTEKILSAMSSGKVWILQCSWLRKALKSRQMQQGMESAFEMSLLEKSIPVFEFRKKWRNQGGIFKDWNVVILTKDPALRKKIGNVLQSGGGTVNSWMLQHLIDQRENLLNQLTLILAEPMMVVESKFQELLAINRELEKSVPIVSYTYIQDYLASGGRASVRDFDVGNKHVLEMHADHQSEEDSRPPLDTTTFGSPGLGIRSQLILKHISNSHIEEENENDNNPNFDHDEENQCKSLKRKGAMSPALEKDNTFPNSVKLNKVKKSSSKQDFTDLDNIDLSAILEKQLKPKESVVEVEGIQPLAATTNTSTLNMEPSEEIQQLEESLYLSPPFVLPPFLLNNYVKTDAISKSQSFFNAPSFYPLTSSPFPTTTSSRMPTFDEMIIKSLATTTTCEPKQAEIVQHLPFVLRRHSSTGFKTEEREGSPEIEILENTPPSITASPGIEIIENSPPTITATNEETRTNVCQTEVTNWDNETCYVRSPQPFAGRKKGHSSVELIVLD